MFSGDLDGVILLIEQGASTRQRNEWGNEACYYNMKEVALKLMASGVALDESELYESMSMNDPEFSLMLIEKGANVNYRKGRDLTTLFQACLQYEKSDSRVPISLIKAGAKVDRYAFCSVCSYGFVNPHDTEWVKVARVMLQYNGDRSSLTKEDLKLLQSIICDPQVITLVALWNRNSCLFASLPKYLLDIFLNTHFRLNKTK